MSAEKTKVVFSSKTKEGSFRLSLHERGKSRELPTASEKDAVTPSFSPDGSTVLYSEINGKKSVLCYVTLSDVTTRCLQTESQNNIAPTFSPDGKQIAWVGVPEITPEMGNKAEIFVSSWPQFSPKKVTHNSRMDVYPVFSEDGSFLLNESGDVRSFFGIQKVTLRGRDSQNEKFLVFDPLHYGNGIPHIFKDKAVFERGDNDGHYNVFEIDIKKPNVLKAKTNWFSQDKDFTSANPTPRFSPDGKWIAAHRCRKIGCEIVILDAESGNENRVFSPPNRSLRLARWNRNGSLLAAENGNEGVVVFDREGHWVLLSAPAPGTFAASDLWRFIILIFGKI